MNLEQLIEKHARIMAEKMLEIAASAQSEEDVRHAVNTFIDEFITKAKLKIRGRHEYGLAGGQLDSKYGGVIIEYKYPHGPDRITEDAEAPGTRKVVEQIQKRFRDFQKQEDIDPSRIFGVGCDGDTLIFVRHRGGKFELEPPQPVTAHTVERLLRALVSLGAKGMSFTPEHLATTFGADNNLAQAPDTRTGIPEAQMKQKYPKTFAYLKRFEPQLRQRRSSSLRRLMETGAFYSMFAVGPYTLAPWKVVWNRIDTKLQGVVVAPGDDGTITLCQETHTFAPMGAREEAHYFGAALNSAPADLLVRSYSVSKGFASAHVMEMLAIPKFNSINELHQMLSSLSHRCHEAAAQGDSDTVVALEAEIDRAAAQLWGITDDELKAIQDALGEM